MLLVIPLISMMIGIMAPILLGINVIIGSIIILIGAKINPETRDVDITI